MQPEIFQPGNDPRKSHGLPLVNHHRSTSDGVEHGVMLSAALRVIARAATIQVEEAAAASARPVVGAKGKQRATCVDRPPVNSTASSAGQTRHQPLGDSQHPSRYASKDDFDSNVAGPSIKPYARSIPELRTTSDNVHSNDVPHVAYAAPVNSLRPRSDSHVTRASSQVEEGASIIQPQHAAGSASAVPPVTPNPPPSLTGDSLSDAATKTPDASPFAAAQSPRATSSVIPEATKIAPTDEESTAHLTETEEEEVSRYNNYDVPLSCTVTSALEGLQGTIIQARSLVSLWL